MKNIPKDAIIRSGSNIYEKVQIGEKFICGHNVLIRDYCKIGDNVSIGTNTILDGHITVESNVDIQSCCYLPPKIIIKSNVFIGPNVVFTNDMKPLKEREKYEPQTTIIEENVSIGANSTILPGIIIKKNSFISAASLVTKNIPPNTLYKNKINPILTKPKWLNELNHKKRWVKK